MLKRSLVATLAATMLAALALAPAAAAQPTQINQGSLISALNNVNVEIDNLQVLSDIGEINVVYVEDVLNNNRVLNNSRFLNNITILQDFLNSNDCSVVAVCDSLKNFLNDNNIVISDVVAVDVLSGGDINVYVQGQ